jgi:hypothetical protein
MIKVKSDLQLKMEPQSRALWEWSVNSYMAHNPEHDKPFKMETNKYREFYNNCMEKALRIYCEAVVDREGTVEESRLLLALGQQMHDKLIARTELELLKEGEEVKNERIL